MTNTYASLTDLKDRLGLGDTADDSDLLPILQSVSREIDRHCGRRFYVETRTRLYTPRAYDRLEIDDLLAVTSLRTDHDGDHTYESTWSTGDYELMPYNAPLESPPEPYTYLERASTGRYYFPAIARGVQVVGEWGHYKDLATSSGTVSTATAVSSTSASTMQVSTGGAFEVGQTLLLSSAEQVWVEAISGNELTVTRGVNGTTPTTHSTAASIQIYRYPLVGELCLQQSILSFRGKDAPTGVLGQGDFQVPIATAGLHPFVKRGLETFRRIRGLA